MNKQRIINICNRWKGQWKYFSPTIAIEDFLASTIFRYNINARHYLNKYSYSKAKKILSRKYSYVIDKWKTINVKQTYDIGHASDVYLFWWQGLEEAPYIVKKCVESIRKNMPGRRCIVISKDNWMKYASIPSYIVEKYHRHIITPALFSDILRCCLLFEHGGIWIDPTCYMSRSLDETIKDYKFYTIRHGDDWEFPICKGKWALFFLASGKGNPVIGFVRDMFFEYWKKEKCIAEYLLIDTFFAIAYDNFEYAKEMIDMVPSNNRNYIKLLEMLKQNNGKDFYKCMKQIDSKTYIHKLTYKMNIDKF